MRTDTISKLRNAPKGSWVQNMNFRAHVYVSYYVSYLLRHASSMTIA